MDDQNRNLILASVLSFLVIIVWFVLFPPPEPPQRPIDEAVSKTENETNIPNFSGIDAVKEEILPQTISETEDVPRLGIETDKLNGTISLKGGRLDDLSLIGYKVELKDGAENVTLLRPVGQEGAYYAAYGWATVSGVNPADVPTIETVWTVRGNEMLTSSSPVTLVWNNGKGLTFSRVISVDDDYLFTIVQGVQNNTDKAVELKPYGIVRRTGEPKDLKNFFILHEGLVRMSDETLDEHSYDKMHDYEFNEGDGTNKETLEVMEDGWIGFTDHFWMTALVPQPGTPFRSTAWYYEPKDIFQAEIVMPKVTISAGQTASVQSQFFAGAKDWSIIRSYENQGVKGFLDSIDWGWFFFLTKPMFFVLHWLNFYIGNMGWAIIGLTLLIKALLFPLAYKSYVSMAKMKELQPEMEKLKENAGDDRQKLQQGMMELYKKEKVNPASGCLPILLQIPIFFSLYKVIFVTLELRHAPWLGWIKDLSAPDPSSILNLFGILPYAPPELGPIVAIISLGILPILLGISMWLQQKLNPAPTDATQAMIFAWMPWVFMFMLGTFASGLVIYWIANNMITFSQQYLIMRSQGYKPDVFGNIMKSFRKKIAQKKG
jgi:YidC/Oxa1 family membrane protein insertase